MTAKTPRQTKINQEALRARYEKFKLEQEKIALQMKIMEQQKEREDQQTKRAYLINRSKEFKQKQSEMLEKIRYDNSFLLLLLIIFILIKNLLQRIAF